MSASASRSSLTVFVLLLGGCYAGTQITGFVPGKVLDNNPAAVVDGSLGVSGVPPGAPDLRLSGGLIAQGGGGDGYQFVGVGGIFALDYRLGTTRTSRWYLSTQVTMAFDATEPDEDADYLQVSDLTTALVGLSHSGRVGMETTSWVSTGFGVLTGRAGFPGDESSWFIGLGVMGRFVPIDALCWIGDPDVCGRISEDHR